ncbi:hypothetical protein [Paenibacillus guangzhouensis]|nr:hypothetical protein [Paenibacillus guangzhouensis]
MNELILILIVVVIVAILGNQYATIKRLAVLQQTVDEINEKLKKDEDQ